MKTLALLSAAHIHAPRFIEWMNEHPEIQTGHVWDDDERRGHEAAEKLNTSFSSSLESVLSDDQVDGVVICSETHKHPDLVRAAVAAGKDLFVEKPLAIAGQDAYHMAAQIEEAGVVFQTGHFMRSWPYNRFLKRQLDAGHFGTVTRIRHSNCHGGSLNGWFDQEWRWMADPKQAGVGGFGDLGGHSLDILLWFMGEVESVTADINIVTGRYEGCDESGEALLKFKNGAVGTLAAGWVDIVHPFRLQISGTEGHALVLGDTLYFQSKHVEGSDIKEPWTDLPEALPHAFQLFLDRISGKEVPLVSVHEAAYANAVMAAIYEAASQKSWVTPQGPDAL